MKYIILALVLCGCNLPSNTTSQPRSNEMATALLSKCASDLQEERLVLKECHSNLDFYIKEFNQANVVIMLRNRALQSCNKTKPCDKTVIKRLSECTKKRNEEVKEITECVQVLRQSENRIRECRKYRSIIRKCNSMLQECVNRCE